MSQTNPPSSPPQAPWREAARRLLHQPRFLAVVAVLGVSAVGLNAATQFMQLHFRKEAVPLPVKALDDPAQGIPAALGPWVQVNKDEPIDPAQEEVLATKQYIFRDYVDTRAESRAPLAFQDLSRGERDKLLFQVQRQSPDAVVKLGVTYYTGLVDTVAHIPDRCYVADGYEPTSHTDVRAAFRGKSDGRPRDITFRLINFDDQSGQGRVTRNVGYFFLVNGDYVSDPFAVRSHLQGLWEKYGFYAKVEMMTVENPNDPRPHKPAAEVMKDFIAAAMPDIEKCLPDWQRVNAKH